MSLTVRIQSLPNLKVAIAKNWNLVQVIQAVAAETKLDLGSFVLECKHSITNVYQTCRQVFGSTKNPSAKLRHLAPSQRFLCLDEKMLNADRDQVFERRPNVRFGWKGFGIRGDRKNDSKWETVFHGTSARHMNSILRHGLLLPGTRTSDAHKIGVDNGSIGSSTDQPAIYTTPSVMYASKPRYSRVVKYQYWYYQTMLELRQRPNSYLTQPGNAGDDYNTQVDEDFDNDSLERLNDDPSDLYIVRLLVRRSRSNPHRLWREKFIG
jgi:hypothetical protein